MMEVGPWRMDENGELWQIEGGWEEYANIVYSRSSKLLAFTYTDFGWIVVDQPVGTGFSYGSTDKYIAELNDVGLSSS
jgi:carboxypeptidase D